jgi:hypothetical protein
MDRRRANRSRYNPPRLLTSDGGRLVSTPATMALQCLSLAFDLAMPLGARINP